MVLGAAAITAIAVGASALAPPGLGISVEAASASAYLNETAASIRAAAANEQTIKTTIIDETLLFLAEADGGYHDPDVEIAGDDPWSHVRTDAKGAVILESSQTFLTDPSGSSVWTSGVDLHAGDLFGDKVAIANAWSATWEPALGALGGEPVASQAPEPVEMKLPVPVTDFPRDPQMFLDSWEAAAEAPENVLLFGPGWTMGAEDMVSTGGFPADDLFVPGQTVGESMMLALTVSSNVYRAPAEYRATFLQALALTDGIVVESDDEAQKVLSLTGERDRYRLTLEPATGMIHSVETFNLTVVEDNGAEVANFVDAGSAPFLSEEIPDSAVRVTSEAVN